MQTPIILSMTINDHHMAMGLWRKTPGIGLSAADEREPMAAYLLRNPGLSQCAWIDDSLIGTVLVGHDGRRGYLHHLCVHEKFRHLGVGRQLVASALAALQAIGLDKAHAFLFTDNDEGRKFWEKIGWIWRTDIGVVSRSISEETGDKR
jgi:putative acetyltransferase